MSICKHKWKYLGFYNGGYYNLKECIHCNTLERELATKQPPKKDGKKINKGGNQ
jgi:hypothetical protein